jgi:hypothetical protein
MIIYSSADFFKYIKSGGKIQGQKFVDDAWLCNQCGEKLLLKNERENI